MPKISTIVFVLLGFILMVCADFINQSRWGSLVIMLLGLGIMLVPTFSVKINKGEKRDG